jgi:hypothetical protein
MLFVAPYVFSKLPAMKHVQDPPKLSKMHSVLTVIEAPGGLM